MKKHRRSPKSPSQLRADFRALTRKNMAHRLRFDTTSAEHQMHYELAHVILLTAKVPLSPAEQNRLGDLQDVWESHGTKCPDEAVVPDRHFTAHRYVLNEDGPPTRDIVLEDTEHDLLLRLCKESQLSGHVARPRRALIAFVEGAEKGKLAANGFVSSAPPTEKAGPSPEPVAAAE